MISGYDEFSYVRQAMRQRVVDYLLKPINRAELDKVLKKIVVERLHGSLVGEAGDDAWYDEILEMDIRELSKLVQKILKIVQEEYRKNLNLSVLSDRLEVGGGYLGETVLEGNGNEVFTISDAVSDGCGEGTDYQHGLQGGLYRK